jgi:NAD(P)-dependent dehydrogenase (short-subunit alcohol dehydrogenase family)
MAEAVNPGQVFAGETAVITGAGSGIGAALSRHAAGLGMRVVAADIAEDRLELLGEELRAMGAEVVMVPTDVADAASVDRLAERAYDAFGSVRLLVNNAGVEVTGYVWEMPADDWSRLMRINVDGVFHGIRAFVPRMLASGERSYVVNLSSVGGIGTAPLQAAYIASKHAVQALTECLYLELQELGAPIQVTCVNPGMVSTRIFEDANAFDAARDPRGGEYLDEMRSLMKSAGIAPAEAAEMIFAAVAAGEFWVPTHPAMFELSARRRTKMLLERTPPPPIVDADAAFAPAPADGT